MKKFELALEEALRQSFAQAGLRFLQVRALEMNLEVLDKVNGKKSEYALQVAEMATDLEGKRSVLSVKNELDLLALAEETAQFELEERKMDLYHRMRQAVNSDKMKEVRTDGCSFLKELDRAEFWMKNIKSCSAPGVKKLKTMPVPAVLVEKRNGAAVSG